MDGDGSEPGVRAAGDFSTWLTGVQAALRGERAADVPCAGCTACCRSSQFVHISPDETDTLARIPAELLFPAPGSPDGHVVLGYDDQGRCPMLADSGCSIYDHRPRTCRTYDCRIFAAAGVVPGDGAGPVAERVRTWRFGLTDPGDVVIRGSVRAAAAFLRDHPEVGPQGRGPANATQLAVLAVEVHHLFLGRRGQGGPAPARPDPEVVRVEVRRRTEQRPPAA